MKEYEEGGHTAIVFVYGWVGAMGYNMGGDKEISSAQKVELCMCVARFF